MNAKPGCGVSVTITGSNGGYAPCGYVIQGAPFLCKDCARCKEHHPESWWPSDKRCDKTEGHKGKHVFQARTMFGPDPSTFTFWDTSGYSATYVDKKARKDFLQQIDAYQEAIEAGGPIGKFEYISR